MTALGVAWCLPAYLSLLPPTGCCAQHTNTHTPEVEPSNHTDGAHDQRRNTRPGHNTMLNIRSCCTNLQTRSWKVQTRGEATLLNAKLASFVGWQLWTRLLWLHAVAACTMTLAAAWTHQHWHHANRVHGDLDCCHPQLLRVLGSIIHWLLLWW